MERKIDEWPKSQNVSSEQTDRNEPPPPPQAHTEQVNAIFIGSEKSDDPSKVQKDPPHPIIVNNKIEKDRPFKTTKGGYYVVKTKEYPFHSIAGEGWMCAGNLLILELVLDNHYETVVRSRSRDIGKGKATEVWVINIVGDLKANPPNVMRCYNCKAQEVGVVLHKEQQDFLVDDLEDLDSDGDDLQLHTTSIFKADHIEAFDSDYHNEPTASTVFMARLSPVAEETKYSKHLVTNNDSYDELTSDNNVISYTEYMVTIENVAVQSVPAPA
ncbi:hypothetical protein Tco_0174855 [Tanacetum coccineum]